MEREVAAKEIDEFKVATQQYLVTAPLSGFVAKVKKIFPNADFKRLSKEKPSSDSVADSSEHGVLENESRRMPVSLPYSETEKTFALKLSGMFANGATNAQIEREVIEEIRQAGDRANANLEERLSKLESTVRTLNMTFGVKK